MTVGWYVHHHGAGHRGRLAAVAPHLPGVVALSSLPADDAPCPWIELPRDDEGGPPADAEAGGALHWAPLHDEGLRGRMAAIARWAEIARPRAFVVDVSVEVTLLARLLGVPVVVVAQRGVRRDPPHALAFGLAAAVAAPWTRATHQPGDGLPDDRLRFTGAISRLDGRTFPGVAAGGDVLLLVGAGGHGLDAADVTAAAAATGRVWHVAGALRAAGEGVVDHGERADVAGLLERCSVVVGGAGGNTVAEVAAARRPFVCLPQDRPFAEQARQADALQRLGVAEVRGRWPEAAEWPGVLAAAESRDPAGWSVLHDGHGAQRLAEVVQAVAA